MHKVIYLKLYIHYLGFEKLYNNNELCKKMGLLGRDKAKMKYNDTIIYNELMNTYNFILKSVNK